MALLATLVLLRLLPCLILGGRGFTSVLLVFVFDGNEREENDKVDFVRFGIPQNVSESVCSLSVRRRVFAKK